MNNGREEPLFDPGRYLDPRDKALFRLDAALPQGIANAPLLIAGHAVKISEHPDEEMNTKWRLLTIRHEGIQPQVWGEDGQGDLLKAPEPCRPRPVGR